MNSTLFGTVFLLLLVPTIYAVPLAGPDCGPVCDIHCEFGNVLDDRGCQTCSCRITKICPPVCLIYCEHGNVLDSNGCPTCRCNP
ncbi:hypothetical protein SNE40_021474 [Patella caerulea]|uniref:Antistasin-like domain-containing protein n=1 Tax=Patella caerulea TaxID=87958 RepID=A0AAN8IXK4_PATCE